MTRFLRHWMRLSAFAFLGSALIVPPSAAAADPPREKPPIAKNAREQLDQILDLKKELEEAMKARDQHKVQDLIAKMQKLMMAERAGSNFQFQILPFPEDRRQPQSELRQQYEKQLKEFADSIEKLKDDKEAREAIEKARDEYKKAMAAELKKTDAEKPNPQALPLPDFRALPQPFPQLDFGGFPLDRQDALQPRFGVRLEKPSSVLIEQLGLPANGGLVIVDVLRSTPAEKAGFKKNDILLQWAGKDLPADVEQFQELIAGAKAGEKIDAVVLRKGKKETIKGVELPEAKRGDRRLDALER